ncbi:MAG: monovalent cation/H+ antiporter complex subunit F [Anaerolineales bacterium]|jgi:multisubunit Na+/H+ antiporter MnhF subunit|nr:MAG: monovalent cation/H+ antiporter complex subunit F [Anaerolineales bacterium]
MENFLEYLIWIVLTVYLGMAIFSAWRALRGENGLVRLTGLDLTSTLTISVLVIVAIITGSKIYIDIAIAAAALGYLSTVALAKYISDQKVF